MRRTHWPTIIGSFGTKVDAIVDKGDGRGTEMHMTIECKVQTYQPDVDTFLVTGLQHFVTGALCQPVDSDSVQLAFQELYPDCQVTTEKYRQYCYDDIPYYRVFVRYPDWMC